MVTVVLLAALLSLGQAETKMPAYVDRYVSVGRQIFGGKASATYRKRGSTYEVVLGSFYVLVHDSGLHGTIHRNSQKHDSKNLKPFRGKPKINTEAEAIRVAKTALGVFGGFDWIQKTEVEFGQSFKGSNPSIDMNPYATVVFYPSPGGYPARLGNSFVVTMDRRTGFVESISLSEGFTYDPPSIRVSETFAIQTARNAMNLDSSAKSTHVDLIYASGSSDGPPYGRILFRARKCRLAYCVTLKMKYSYTADIDAENGKVIWSGGLSKSH